MAGRVPKPGRGATKAQAPDRPAGEKTRRPFDMYVGNIPWACTEAEVRAFFEEKGGFKPTALIMLKDEKTRRFKVTQVVVFNWNNYYFKNVCGSTIYVDRWEQ